MTDKERPDLFRAADSSITRADGHIHVNDVTSAQRRRATALDAHLGRVVERWKCNGLKLNQQLKEIREVNTFRGV